MRLEQDFTIARPPEAVFDFMVRPENLGKWQTVHDSCVPLDDGPPRQGYRMRETLKAGPIRQEQVTEFSEFEPGRLLHARVIEGRPSWGRWELEPDGAGTRVRFSAEFAFPGLLRPLAALQWRRFHRNLRREVERG